MIIGVTGTLATGKTTVAKIIARLKKAELLDADRIAHNVLDKDKTAGRKVASYFGNEILDKKGRINRKKLADIVFFDKKKLTFLCRIIHPEVIGIIKSETKKYLKKGKHAAVVIDAPLLIESKLHLFCDVVVVVAASVSKILERAKQQAGLSKKEALKRVCAQMPIKEKQKHADYIIHNNGSMKGLEKKVKDLVKKI